MFQFSAKITLQHPSASHYLFIDGDASKPHITIFEENEIFNGNIFLIPFSIKCQWLVPKFECKVYENGKNRNSKHSVSSLF